MKDDEELWEICKDIYRELYEKATPPADFDELKNGKLAKESDRSRPYNDHYLAEDKQQSIIENHIEEHSLREPDARKVRKEITLGASPAGQKQAWNNEEQD